MISKACILLSFCSSTVFGQDVPAGFIIVDTVTAGSSESCNQLCIANSACVSADYGSSTTGSVNGQDFVANDRSCIMYGRQASPTPAPIVQVKAAPAVVKVAPPVVRVAQPVSIQQAPQNVGRGGCQYQVYIKAAQCRFISRKRGGCEYSTRGSIHLIFHGTAGTSQKDVIWRTNGLRAGMASTETVYSDDVGEITHVSYFVPGKDTFKPEIVVINKMCSTGGVYFTEPHLLMSESMLEPYQLGQVGRYYYRYPVYKSHCQHTFSSLTDWFLKCRPNHSPTPAPKEYCGDIEMNELKNYWLIEQEASSEWRYFDVGMHTPSALLVEVLPDAHTTTDRKSVV